MSQGYWQFDCLPSDTELQEHYEKKYYQQNHGAYSHQYSLEEVRWKLFQEWLVIRGLSEVKNKGRALDIGCGEGYLLRVLEESGFDVQGVDFSSYGLIKENPTLLDRFIQADINKFVHDSKNLNSYDVISIMHVIEHVKDPEYLLRTLRSKMNDNAVLIVRFPNDDSQLHQFIASNTATPKDWWLAYPEHLSYFNHDSMQALLSDCGFDIVGKIADHPIDFNLLNDNSNYVIEKSKGKATHHYRVLLDNFLSELNRERYYSILNNYAEMGVGRNLTFFAKITGNRINED